MTTENEFLAQLDRQLFFNAVNDEMTLYCSEHNGLSLWRALKMCHDAKEPLPEFVVAKFAEWAEKLEGATTPREMAVALDLSGDDKQYKGPAQLRAVEKRRRIASQVEQVRTLYNINLKQAIAIVARNSGRSVAKIKGDHYAFFKPRNQRAKPNDLDAVLRGWGRS